MARSDRGRSTGRIGSYELMIFLMFLPEPSQVTVVTDTLGT